MHLFVPNNMYYDCSYSYNHTKLQVDNGYRMPPPTGCPKAVYDVMMLCWQCEPQDRPNFSDLHDILVHLEETIDYS